MTWNSSSQYDSYPCGKSAWLQSLFSSNVIMYQPWHCKEASCRAESTTMTLLWQRPYIGCLNTISLCKEMTMTYIDTDVFSSYGKKMTNIKCNHEGSAYSTKSQESMWMLSAACQWACILWYPPLMSSFECLPWNAQIDTPREPDQTSM